MFGCDSEREHSFCRASATGVADLACYFKYIRPLSCYCIIVGCMSFCTASIMHFKNLTWPKCAVKWDSMFCLSQWDREANTNHWDTLPRLSWVWVNPWDQCAVGWRKSSCLVLSNNLSHPDSSGLQGVISFLKKLKITRLHTLTCTTTLSCRNTKMHSKYNRIQ